MSKRNIAYIISYILEILLILLGTVFYRQPLLSILLLLFILLIPISIIVTKHQLDKLSISITSNCHEAVIDSIIDIDIVADYKGFIPLLNCTIELTYNNLYYPNSDINEFTFPAEARRKGRFTLPLYVTKAGMMSINANKLCVTDYLHIYTFTIPISNVLEIPILPRDVSVPSYSKVRVSQASEAGDPSEINSSMGERTRDIKQLHEYRAGDRLRDIHWKLSAKSDKLMVREYDETKELNYLIFPILTSANTNNDSVDNAEDKLQKTLEVLFAIGKDLLKDKEPFLVAIYEKDYGALTTKLVTDENELRLALYALYRSPIERCEGAYDSYRQSNPLIAGGEILIRDGEVIRG